jgi:hypothetical protein
LNGQRLIQDERHRIIVNEAGCHALLLTSARLEDAGTISCLAKNGSGESAFQVIVHFVLKCNSKLVSISSTFYKQLMRPKIPKAYKDTDYVTEFLRF